MVWRLSYKKIVSYLARDLSNLRLSEWLHMPVLKLINLVHRENYQYHVVHGAKIQTSLLPKMKDVLSSSVHQHIK